MKVAQLRDHIDAGGDGVEDFELLVGRDRGVRQDSRNTSLSARASLKSYRCDALKDYFEDVEYV
jgi:hypothetical protein